jgi:hypothetical protein
MLPHELDTSICTRPLQRFVGTLQSIFPVSDEWPARSLQRNYRRSFNEIDFHETATDRNLDVTFRQAQSFRRIAHCAARHFRQRYSEEPQFFMSFEAVRSRFPFPGRVAQVHDIDTWLTARAYTLNMKVRTFTANAATCQECQQNPNGNSTFHTRRVRSNEVSGGSIVNRAIT